MIFLLCFFSLACEHTAARERKMILEAESILKKVELFESENDQLPNSLRDLGLKEKDGYNTVYYYKRDSFNFTLSFPISAESHLYCYSDTQSWEEVYRKMHIEE